MKRSNRLYIVVFLIILIAIIPHTRRLIFAPIFSATSYLGRSVARSSLSSFGFIRGVVEIKDLKNENERLKKELADKSVEIVRIGEIEYENQVLKNQLGFVEEHKEIELISSKIIGREPTSYMDTITIDKGNESGVFEGATVIYDGALVGKISTAQENSSIVTLITSKNSVIQAMLQTSRVMGVLKGGLSGNTLENIPQDVAIGKSEKVITSGLGGKMNQGILIGEVTGQRSSKSEIFKVMSVTPQVDFSRLEMVFIIKQPVN
jgi:rod shape-determining protein MreC